MPITADRVLETSPTTGVGPLSLAGTQTRFRTFANAFGVHASRAIWYSVESQGANEWEVGIGRLTGASTLTRDTVLASSNGGALVNFGAGTKNVFSTAPAAAIKPFVSSSVVRYVALDGDDASAVAGDISRPYQGVRAAVDACSPGDVVALLPGVHNGAAPLILKNGCKLTSVYGRSVTKIFFDGTFVMQQSGATLPSQHGAQIQPSLGTPDVDACFVVDLDLEVEMNIPPHAYAALTGVNTAAGTAQTGTGASYADMHVIDCKLDGKSDVHIVIDAVQRTYFHRCEIHSGYDFIHLIGPSNSALAAAYNTKLVYKPFYNGTLSYGPTLDTMMRVRSGVAILSGCELITWNDGTTDWLSRSSRHRSRGFCVDNFPGAKLIIEGGLPWRHVGDPFPMAVIPRFCSSGTTAGAASSGAVYTSSALLGLAQHNAYTTADNMNPPRLIPQADLSVHADLFASAALSTTKNNTYWANAAATSQTIYMLNLPPGSVIRAVRLDRRTAFGGGAATATTVEVGTPGNTTKFLAATDIRTTGGVINVPTPAVEGSGDLIAGAAVQVVITLRNTGANLSTLTAGDCRVVVDLAGMAGA